MIPEKLKKIYGDQVIRIDDNHFIVTMIQNEYEVITYVIDADNIPIQDLSLTRFEAGKITQLLWLDDNDEDYTHKFRTNLTKLHD